MHVRTAATDPTGQGQPEWLQVIWKANEVAPGTFGRPEHTGPWWAGGSVEEYPDARVLHRGDGTVSVVSKTPQGDQVLRRSAAALGIHVIAPQLVDADDDEDDLDYARYEQTSDALRRAVCAALAAGHTRDTIDTVILRAEHAMREDD